MRKEVTRTAPSSSNFRTIPCHTLPAYPSSVRRLTQFLISAIAIAVIPAGARYAIARESVRDTNLHDLYQQINQESFGEKLQEVTVNWDDLTEQDAVGTTDFDENGTAVSIELDRKEITDERDLRRVLRHEACHVYVGATEIEHGDAWQDCMKRF
jgi:SprT-like family